MRGDLLFFAPGPWRSDWKAHVIALATRGPFCHVAVDLGDGTNLAATQAGITIQVTDVAVSGRWGALDAGLSRDQISAGLDWLRGQLGEPYGYPDILSHVLKIIGLPFQVSQPKHYDCSDLATRYLVHADFGGLGPLADNPSLVSPNDLARQLGVIK